VGYIAGKAAWRSGSAHCSPPRPIPPSDSPGQTQSRPPRKAVRLASTVWSPHLPTTVFVHGLESSREMWRSTLGFCAANAMPAIAVDLRGHGESDLGDPADFSTDQVVDDVHEAAVATGPGKIVLVGHSMGGRVAMSYAAKYPDHVAALIIEDMDLVPRAVTASPHGPFNRRFETDDAAVEALRAVGYGEDRTKYWRGSRIRPLPTGGVWSDVSPESRDLAMKHVLASSDGLIAFEALGRRHATAEGGLPFPVHVLVAGRGSACRDPAEMTRLLPAATVHTFAESGHSIHREAAAGFCDVLRNVVWSAAKPTASPPPPDARL